VKMWSDWSPQFKSDEFLAFLRDWDISNGRSSPHHSQSNGYAEPSNRLRSSSRALGRRDRSTLTILARLCFSSATRLCRAELHHHKLFSAAQRAISFLHTGVHSLRNGSKPLSYWKSVLNMQRNFKLNTSTVLRTPSHPWWFATAWSSKTISQNVGPLLESSLRWGHFGITSWKRQLVGCSAAIGVFFASAPPGFRSRNLERIPQLRIHPPSGLVWPLRQRLQPISVVRVALPPRPRLKIINVSFCFICVSRSFSFESISSYVSFETRSYPNSVITPYLFASRVLSLGLFFLFVGGPLSNSDFFFVFVYVRGKRHTMTRQRRPTPPPFLLIIALVGPLVDRVNTHRVAPEF
jgi:hypothetical protein